MDFEEDFTRMRSNGISPQEPSDENKVCAELRKIVSTSFFFRSVFVYTVLGNSEYSRLSLLTRLLGGARSLVQTPLRGNSCEQGNILGIYIFQNLIFFPNAEKLHTSTGFGARV